MSYNVKYQIVRNESLSLLQGEVNRICCECGYVVDGDIMQTLDGAFCLLLKQNQNTIWRDPAPIKVVISNWPEKNRSRFAIAWSKIFGSK